MLIKISLLALALACCEGVLLYSSFWAPLFNPRILNFRVDAPIEPDAGKKDRDQYINNYGARGEKLIEDLGNGKGPSDIPYRNKGDVKFYYTYPGARRDQANYNAISYDSV